MTDPTSDVEITVTRVSTDDDHIEWAGGFWLHVDGAEHGWVLDLYPTKHEAETGVAQAILAAMTRTFPPAVGEDTP